MRRDIGRCPSWSTSSRSTSPASARHSSSASTCAGRPLQQLVWAQLREIPYGATTSYGELAGRIEESAYPEGLEPYQRVRLAAAAIGRTPTPILVPCHRVIGADGSLTGYGGGLQRKQALLDLESKDATRRAPESPANRQLALL